MTVTVSKTEIDGVFQADLSNYPEDKWNVLSTQLSGEKYIVELEYIGNIPQSVPLWAMKAVLEEKGLLDVIEGVFDTLEPTTKKKVLIFWNNGNFIERQSQTVAMLGQILSKTDDEIDGYFIDADKLML